MRKDLTSPHQIQSRIDRIDAELRTMDVEVDRSVRITYEKTERALIQSRDACRNKQNELNHLISSNASTKESWTTKMEQMMSMTNDNFKEYFDEMGCKGRITFGPLPRNQQSATYGTYHTCQKFGSDEYDHYGIIIWVSFRAGADMTMLTGSTQSGGEKSVSTMLFLLSMQPISKSPFRLIDEINQGMDNRNERKIFETLVNAANRSRTQYFLITPKLLQNLDYGDNLALGIVHNGPHFGYIDKKDNYGRKIAVRPHKNVHPEYMAGYERRRNARITGTENQPVQLTQESQPEVAPVFARSSRRVAKTPIAID